MLVTIYVKYCIILFLVFCFLVQEGKKEEVKEMVSGLINANPVIYEKKERRVRSAPSVGDDEHAVEPIDQLEVFDILFIIFS